MLQEGILQEGASDAQCCCHLTQITHSSTTKAHHHHPKLIQHICPNYYYRGRWIFFAGKLVKILQASRLALNSQSEWKSQGCQERLAPTTPSLSLFLQPSSGSNSFWESNLFRPWLPFAKWIECLSFAYYQKCPFPFRFVHQDIDHHWLNKAWPSSSQQEISVQPAGPSLQNF